MDNRTDNIVILNFGEAKPPVFKEVGSKDWLMMNIEDYEDDYPGYLLYLLKNSSKHGAIVKGKAGYIFGKGLKQAEESAKGKEWLNSVNRYGQKLNDIVKKSILDIEVFYGFYWQIIPSFRGFEIYKLDWRKVRKSKAGDGYWYKKDGKWTEKKEPAVKFPTYYPGIRQASIFAYYEYGAGEDQYPEPEYSNATNYIEADIVVGQNTLSNARGGFSASKFINFYNGEPIEEIKTAIEKKFTKKFTGPGGRKIIIGFNDDPAKRPTIDDLGTSDLTKEDFNRVDKQIEQNIFTAHRVTSPILFGIKTEGQLGGRNEMREAYEIFKNTYANEKQQNIEEVINFFAAQLGLGEFTLMPVEPIGFEFSESTIKEIAPKKYLLDKIGIDPQEYPEAVQPVQEDGLTNEKVNDNLKNLTGKQFINIERIVRKYKKGNLTKEVAASMLKSGYGFSDAEIEALLKVEDEQLKVAFSEISDDELIQAFTEIGEAKDGFTIVRSKKALFTSDKEMIEDELNYYQESFKDDVDRVNNREAKILEMIKKDKRVTPEVISKALKIPVDEVKEKLEDLVQRELISTTIVKENGNDVEHRELKQPISEVTEKKQRVEILVRYSYEGPKDERNRTFCAKMLELDRFYTRTEIEKISERLGYSVWDRSGGFWRKPDGTISPKCRHHWKSNVVLKKKSAA